MYMSKKSHKKKKILVLHGPNLNMLGKREKKIYGKISLEKINSDLKSLAEDLNVELKFKLRLVNQTSKIIDSALIVWERQLPFTDKLTMIKETKISKPIVPYQKRTIEYNDLDSKREGETYKVKIAHIIFEDGTQWKNPL